MYIYIAGSCKSVFFFKVFNRKSFLFTDVFLEKKKEKANNELAPPPDKK